MNKKIISALLLILGIVTIIIGLSSNTFFGGRFLIIIGIPLIVLSARISRQYDLENKSDNENDTKVKLCKYCKEEIPFDAKVCSYCRKTQNFSIVRVIIGVIIGFFIISYILPNTLIYKPNTTYNTSKSNYITLDEFNRIENGMSYQQVVDIIGSEGTVMSESEVMDAHTIIYY